MANFYKFCTQYKTLDPINKLIKQPSVYEISVFFLLIKWPHAQHLIMFSLTFCHSVLCLPYQNWWRKFVFDYSNYAINSGIHYIEFISRWAYEGR